VSFAYLFIIFERCASTPTLKPLLLLLLLLLLRVVVSSLQRSYSDSRSIYPSNSVYSYGWAHALWCRALHPQNKKLHPKVTAVRLLQVHLVHHDVPRPQRHCAHHHHGPLRVRRPASSTLRLPHTGSRSVAASVFGVIYLAMIISTVTNLLSFTPDEQALVSAHPRLHRPLPVNDGKSLPFRQTGCRPLHPAAASCCCPPHRLLVHTPPPTPPPTFF
jgi:hypothetical protein